MSTSTSNDKCCRQVIVNIQKMYPEVKLDGKCPLCNKDLSEHCYDIEQQRFMDNNAPSTSVNSNKRKNVTPNKKPADTYKQDPTGTVKASNVTNWNQMDLFIFKWIRNH